MTLVYHPGSTPVHRLDPRSKLLVQATFVAAAFVYTTPRGLVALSALVAGILAVAQVPPARSLWEFRFVLPLVVAAPLLEGVTLGSPWFLVADAVGPVLASYRVVLVLLVTATYVRTTPVRESRAAIQWAVPGRAGQFLGTGAGFVFRFLPVLQDDIARIRDAQRARLGTERSVIDRVQLLVVAALNRAFERSECFALALQARCFAWNPTLPELRFGYRDVPALALAAGLVALTVDSAI